MLTDKELSDAQKSILDEIDSLYAEDDHEMRDAVKPAVHSEFAALRKLAITTTRADQSPSPA